MHVAKNEADVRDPHPSAEWKEKKTYTSTMKRQIEESMSFCDRVVENQIGVVVVVMLKAIQHLLAQNPFGCHLQQQQ